MKKVAILQSNYMPWKGYFDLINMVDEFILYDDMQYTKRDWRNRNKIKTPQGTAWLSIPVEVSGKYYQRINETAIVDTPWCRQHFGKITEDYRRARFFPEYRSLLADLYVEAQKEKRLSSVNFLFLQSFCGVLNIKTSLKWSMDYTLIEGKTERLVDLCKQASATHYISGPAARSYIDGSLFHDAGISLSFVDYSDYPEYEQLYPPFEHGVSIIDLILNTGPDAPKYMKSF